MSEIGDDFKALKAMQRERKESWKEENLENHLNMLSKYPQVLTYEIKNNGEHYIVTIKNEDISATVDLWPSTGKWIIRKDKKRGNGIPNLLKYFKLPISNSAIFIISKD